MDKKQHRSELGRLTRIYKLLEAFKKTKNEKYLDEAMSDLKVLHETSHHSYKKKKRSAATDAINSAIEDLNQKNKYRQ